MKGYTNKVFMIILLFIIFTGSQHHRVSLGSTDDCSYKYRDVAGHIEGTISPNGFFNQYLNKAWLSTGNIRENIQTELTVDGCMLRHGEKDDKDDEKTNVIIRVVDSNGRIVTQDLVETNEDGSYRSKLTLNEKAGTYTIQIYPKSFSGFGDRIEYTVYAIADTTKQLQEEEERQKKIQLELELKKKQDEESRLKFIEKIVITISLLSALGGIGATVTYLFKIRDQLQKYQTNRKKLALLITVIFILTMIIFVLLLGLLS